MGGGEGEGEGGGEVGGELGGEPGLSVELVTELSWDSSHGNAQVLADGERFAVFGRYARVEVYPLIDPVEDEFLLWMEPERVLVHGVSVSPTGPSLLITTVDWELQTWSTAEERPPLHVLPFGARFSNPSFNSAGDRAVVMSEGRARVLRVDNTLGFTFSENEGLPTQVGQRAVFTGGDWVVLIEDKGPPRMRVFHLRDDAPDDRRIVTLGMPDNPCEQAACLTGAQHAQRVALCCGDGSVQVRDPGDWRGATVVVRDGAGEVDSVALSHTGRFLAILRGPHLYVRDLQTNGSAYVDGGQEQIGDPPEVHFGPNDLLAVDFRRRTAIYRVTAAAGQ